MPGRHGTPRDAGRAQVVLTRYKDLRLLGAMFFGQKLREWDVTKEGRPRGTDRGRFT